MDPEKIQIEDLLPHRGRMRLVEDIVELAEGRAVTRSIVNEKWPLREGEAVQALILIELVAQTAGINNGWTRIRLHGLESEKKGWLVGIKKASFAVATIPLNTPILTYAENRFEYDSFREIHGYAEINGRRVGEVTLQVFQSGPEESVF